MVRIICLICVKVKGMYRTFLKRGLDFTLSLIGLVVLMPVFLVIGLWIKLDSRGPVFFRQKRIGMKKKEFYLYKFRTMRIDTPRDTPTHLLQNPKSYITNCGKFLRLTSLDELPQLYNIIRGEMSIVGPRPALWNQDDLVAERDRLKVNDVRPGLTGWAQVNGRDELPIPVKAALDGEYVRKLSLWMDVKCLFKTVVCVIMRKNVVEGGIK